MSDILPYKRLRNNDTQLGAGSRALLNEGSRLGDSL